MFPSGFPRQFIALSLAVLSSMLSYGESLTAANVNTPSPQLITAGQPTASDLKVLKAMGVTKVINLRSPEEEMTFDEQAVAASLGLEYVSLPITGATDITKENALKLNKLLDTDGKIFLHCASSNRVGALLALRSHFVENMPLEDALEYGKSAGLTTLENATLSELLSEQ